MRIGLGERPGERTMANLRGSGRHAVAEDACIFCEILAGNAEASFVYRDEVCSAFMDVRPVTPGHVLVVPNRHAASPTEVEPEDWARVAEVGRQLAGALPGAGIRCEGVNLFLADGEIAGQEVFHVHLHVLPRFSGDGFGLRFPEGYPSFAPRDELDAMADRIASASRPTAAG